MRFSFHVSAVSVSDVSGVFEAYGVSDVSGVSGVLVPAQSFN